MTVDTTGEDVTRFIRKYDAWVGPSTRRMERIPKFSNWQEYADVTASNTIEYERVPCVEIHMPVSRFQAMTARETWLNEFLDRNRGYPPVRYAERLVEEWEEECHLRHENPSLQSAWEQYQVLLRLFK